MGSRGRRRYWTAGSRTRQSRFVIVIGLMSGTSADGVDAVAAEIGSERPRPRVHLLAHVHRDYPEALRARILAAGEGESLTTAEIGRASCRGRVEGEVGA